MSSTEASMRLGVGMQDVGVARKFVQATFDGVVPRGIAADLVLATSELVTNAIEHGGSSSVLVTARIDSSHASVTIHSSGRADRLAEPDAWHTPSPDRITGRGLGIVSAVADDVAVVRTGDDVAITVSKRLSS